MPPSPTPHYRQQRAQRAFPQNYPSLAHQFLKTKQNTIIYSLLYLVTYLVSPLLF